MARKHKHADILTAIAADLQTLETAHRQALSTEVEAAQVRYRAEGAMLALRNLHEKLSAPAPQPEPKE